MCTLFPDNLNMLYHLNLSHFFHSFVPKLILHFLFFFSVFSHHPKLSTLCCWSLRLKNNTPRINVRWFVSWLSMLCCATSIKQVSSRLPCLHLQSLELHRWVKTFTNVCCVLHGSGWVMAYFCHFALSLALPLSLSLSLSLNSAELNGAVSLTGPINEPDNRPLGSRSLIAH